MTGRIVLFATLLFALSNAALASLPQTINYQGYLKSGDGTPVNSEVFITFSLYTAASGGSPIWSEQQTIVPVNGVYSAQMGSVNFMPASVFANDTLYLGIKVEHDAEMSPRQQLAMVPFAVRSGTADSVAAGGVGTSSMAAGAVTTATLADGSVSTVKLASGAVTDAKITGPLADAKLSSNVDLLDKAQSITGMKSFNPGSASSPFVVGEAKTGLVAHLNAEMVGGQKLADLDLRYGQRPVAQIPRANTVTTLDGTGNVGQYTSITVGADGLPFISYFDVGNADLKVAHCSNSACTAATFTTVDSTGDVGKYGSMAIGADGLPIIAYFDGTNYDLKVAHCSDVMCTSATLTTVDSTGSVGDFASIAIGADGLAIISYHDQTHATVKSAHCGNASCSSYTTTTVDNYGDPGRYSTSIWVGPDGLPVISCVDNFNHCPHVDHCSNAACTSVSRTVFTNTEDASSGYSSIIVGSDGLPVIAYLNGNQFKAAHCDDSACTSHVMTILDNPGSSYYHTSITVGSDGLPVMSYYDSVNMCLKVVHCSNAACTGATAVVADSSGDVGRYSSITIGTDGLPLIAYYDNTNGDLKVIKCANQFCANNLSRR